MWLHEAENYGRAQETSEETAIGWEKIPAGYIFDRGLNSI